MRQTILCSLVVASFLTLGLLATAIAAETKPQPEQQMFYKDNSITWDREKVGQDGVGTLAGKYPFNRNTALKGDVIKEIGWMTLKPGHSIGMHKHDSNEDAYIILSGEGTFIDTNGKEYKVKSGDTTIARKGQAHALKNTGKKPLVFLDVVAE